MTRDLDIESTVRNLLLQSADLVAEAANSLCHGGHVDSLGCAWYHGAWQYLRIADLVSSPAWHGAFYREALTRIATDVAMPIQALVSGAADYSMVAYADAHLSRGSKAPALTVVDGCATPLFACKWYARTTGRQLRLWKTDIRLLTKNGHQYDVICTDAFLTRFQRKDLFDILATWNGLLKDHGYIVTTIRLTPADPDNRSLESLVHDFTKRAAHRWSECAIGLRPSPNEFVKLAEEYARRMKSTPFVSKDKTAALLESRFLIESIETAEVPGELHPTRYARIIMRKRNVR